MKRWLRQVLLMLIAALVVATPAQAVIQSGFSAYQWPCAVGEADGPGCIGDGDLATVGTGHAASWVYRFKVLKSETDGPQGWSRYKQAADRTIAAGGIPLPILIAPQSSIEAFTATAITQLSNVTYFQIYNEPNAGIADDFAHDLGAVDFAANWYCPAVRSANSAARSVTLIPGGISAPGTGVTPNWLSWQTWLKDFIVTSQNQCSSIHTGGIAIHPYSGDATTTANLIRAARDVQTAYTAGKWLWVTEWGHPSTAAGYSEEKQKTLLVDGTRWADANRTNCHIAGMYWFGHNDGTANPDDTGALKHADNSPKPAWWGWIQALDGDYHTGTAQTSPPRDAPGVDEGGCVHTISTDQVAGDGRSLGDPIPTNPIAGQEADNRPATVINPGQVINFRPASTTETSCAWDVGNKGAADNFSCAGFRYRFANPGKYVVKFVGSNGVPSYHEVYVRNWPTDGAVAVPTWRKQISNGAYYTVVAAYGLDSTSYGVNGWSVYDCAYDLNDDGSADHWGCDDYVLPDNNPHKVKLCVYSSKTGYQNRRNCSYVWPNLTGATWDYAVP